MLAGVGVDNGMAARALDSVRERLATGHGIVLLQPAYRRYHVELGEISSYPPGYKENASVFCHTNPWVMIAEAMVGRGDAAFDYYKRINPSAREDISELHRCEPYVYAQMIAGKEAPTHGEAKNSWLTGTAAWNLVAITQWILGIRAELDGLRIDPVLPAAWPGFTATRRFRGATYEISVRKPPATDRPGQPGLRGRRADRGHPGAARRAGQHGHRRGDRGVEEPAMRIFSRRPGSAALAVLLTGAAATVAVTFGATRAPADTGAACAGAYSVGWQTPSNSPPDFGATVTVTNNSSYTISTWTITLTFSAGQTLVAGSAYSADVTQSGATLTATPAARTTRCSRPGRAPPGGLTATTTARPTRPRR